MSLAALDGTDPKTKIILWRYDQLRRLGVDPMIAEMVARDDHVDVREVESLVMRGCPAEVAVDILT